MHCKLSAKKKEFINQKMEFEFEHSFLLEVHCAPARTRGRQVFAQSCQASSPSIELK